MKRTGKIASANGVVALALTWDGARWPAKSLPPKARAFLKGPAKNLVVPDSRKLSAHFSDNQVREIRICWVPCLKGGPEVLSEPFQTASGKRLNFRSVETTHFGDVLGVVYRRHP